MLHIFASIGQWMIDTYLYFLSIVWYIHLILLNFLSDPVISQFFVTYVLIFASLCIWHLCFISTNITDCILLKCLKRIVKAGLKSDKVQKISDEFVWGSVGPKILCFKGTILILCRISNSQKYFLTLPFKRTLVDGTLCLLSGPSSLNKSA